MNVITVAGTLGKDAEVKYLANGDAICNFSVADSMGRDKGNHLVELRPVRQAC